jgi:hypothetical protein
MAISAKQPVFALRKSKSPQFQPEISAFAIIVSLFFATARDMVEI